MSFLTASTRRLAAVAAVAATAGLAGSAFAGNGVTFELSVDGGPATIFAPGGNDVGNGVFNYAEQVFGPNYTVSWDINAKGFDNPFISGNFVIVNNTIPMNPGDDGKVTFTLKVILPVSAALLPASLIGGSVAGGLTTDLDGGSVNSIGNTPLWQAFIDGAFAASLLDGPFSASKFGAGSVAIGPESFGAPIPNQPGPAIKNTMEILLTFSLTAGDQVSFTSVFTAVAIPAPAGLAFLGLAGLAGVRSRRRN